jgi:peptidoglycan/xylan/chitin deacetylase (PgdA/CDA1 family)
MFNYRNTTAFCFIVMLLSIILGLNLDNRRLIVAGILFLAVCLAILVLGSVFIQWNFYFFSFSHGDRNIPSVAITFDDGPDEKTTPKILSILEKYNVKATFFCIGEKIEKYPSVFKSIIEKGHTIGNHSHRHTFWFDFYSSRMMTNEIAKTDEIIYGFIGKKPKLFRPPYGVTNPIMKKALRITGHLSVAWSLRSFDTAVNAERVLRNVKRKLKNGDIIIFHDTVPTNPRIIGQFIDDTQKSGKQFIGLDELLKIKPYDSSN